MLKAILIDVIPPYLTKEDADYRMMEAENLIHTYGGVVLIKKLQKKFKPAYGTFIGEGKISEIIEEQEKLGANILIINNELKPQQIYNLQERFRDKNSTTRDLKLQVWDRIDLILKIFQKHAETREAKLEIELASIRHMGPRIYGMGMQLTRQGGGVGTRGQGETNLEIMKRHLDKAEDRILKELEACKKVRLTHRKGRTRKNLKTIGIIGYTNAGKTSLLNALTGKGAYAADKLFATLDTRVGKLFLGNPESKKKSAKQNAKNKAAEEQDNYGTHENPYIHSPHLSYQDFALISDTIGFIQDLPPTLIKSFASTLEETIEADLLLHVIDIADPKIFLKIITVNQILGQISALHKPTIYVFNKIDSLPKKIRTKKFFAEITKEAMEKAHIVFKPFGPVFVSTQSNEGIEELRSAIAKIL